MTRGRVLVLGAYGLAGRAIVAALREGGEVDVIASGRRPERLAERFGVGPAPRVETRVLDATDEDALRGACADADVVVNAVGPFLRSGFGIARTVVAAGRHYVDCANEQLHYERLRALDAKARDGDVLLACGAGVIPGLSSLLAARLLEESPAADRLDIVWAQRRHAFEDGGQASMMGGVLDADHRPWAVRDGRRAPVTVGRSRRDWTLPEPFGRLRLLEVPTIDVAVFAERARLREIRTWFHVGDAPPLLFGLIRLLGPSRHAWAYRLVDRIVARRRRLEFARAVARGIGPEALLLVRTSGASGTRDAAVRFRDGASPTAVLPARIARDLLAGVPGHRGLATPVDLLRWDDVAGRVRETAVAIDLPADATA